MRRRVCFFAMIGECFRRFGPESLLFSSRDGSEFSVQSSGKRGFSERRGLQFALARLSLGLLIVNDQLELFFRFSEFDALDPKLFDRFSIFEKQRLHRLVFFFQFFTLAFSFFQRKFFLVPRQRFLRLLHAALKRFFLLFQCLQLLLSRESFIQSKRGEAASNAIFLRRRKRSSGLEGVL